MCEGADGPAPRWRVVWARVRVRSAPGDGGTHVEWLCKGAEIESIGEDGSWIRLSDAPGGGQRWLPLDGAAAGMSAMHAARPMLVRVTEAAEGGTMPGLYPDSPSAAASFADPAAGASESPAASPPPESPPGSPHFRGAAAAAGAAPAAAPVGRGAYQERWAAHLRAGGGAARRVDTCTRLWAVSDCHIDHKANMAWLESLVDGAQGHADDDGVAYRSGAVIVAGDLATGLGMLEKGLRLFCAAFGRVFYCVGNHELWGGRPDSVEKFFSIMELCQRLGVITSAAALGDQLVVAPLQSWYKSDFIPAPVTKQTEHFDGGCTWPACVGDPARKNNSLSDNIADFFLSLNEPVVAAAKEAAAGSGAQVVSFSHFIPRPELYPGYHSLGRVMGCHELDTYIRQLGSVCHVFGHSHLDVDAQVGGCRYVQNNLGYPRDRWMEPGPPIQVWPPCRPRRACW